MKFKISDIVEDKLLGYGKVININSDVFPVQAIFRMSDLKKDIFNYNEDGSYNLDWDVELKVSTLPSIDYKLNDKLIITIEDIDIYNYKTKVIAVIYRRENNFFPVILDNGDRISGDGKYYYMKDNNEVYNMAILKI